MTPSEQFISLTRNPRLLPPVRWEPTIKKPGELVLVGGKFVEVK